MATINLESNDNIPEDEMDLAEELAECIGDSTFPSLSDPDMDDYVDTLAELYATA